MAKRSTVKYTPKLHDGYHTQEQQAQVLTHSVERVLHHWCRKNENGEDEGVIGQDPLLDNAMRIMRQHLTNMDIFYSGLQQGRKNG